jgi:hypothetical protein
VTDETPKPTLREVYQAALDNDPRLTPAECRRVVSRVGPLLARGHRVQATPTVHNVPLTRKGAVPLITAWSSEHGGIGQVLLRPRHRYIAEWVKDNAKEALLSGDARPFRAVYRKPTRAYSTVLALRLAESAERKRARRRAERSAK